MSQINCEYNPCRICNRLEKIFWLIIGALFMFIFLHVCEVKAEICFDKEISGKMVMRLEECNSIEEGFALCEQARQEIEGEIVKQKQIIELQKEQVKEGEKSLNECKGLVDSTISYYENALKESKPSKFVQFFERLGYVAGGVLLGFLIGGIL